MTLSEYLDHLRNARQQTDEAVVLLGPAHQHASDALAATWEAVFDHLCKKRPKGAKPRELEELNKIAGIMYKLLQGAHRMKTIEHKTLDYEEKLACTRATAKRAREMVIKQGGGLPVEIRAQLERELKLLG